MLILKAPSKALQRLNPQPEKVRGMNASLAGPVRPGPLRERDPGRMAVTRRQVAWALVLAVLGVIAGLYTAGAVSTAARTFPAEVTTSKVYDLNFYGSGRLTSILVKVGQTVRAGQVLARQDTTELQSQVTSAAGVVAADQQAVAQYQAPQLSAAQKQQDALQVQQAQTAVANAQVQLAAAEASGRAAVAASQSAQASAAQLVVADQQRYGQACPGGPVPPPAGLVGSTLQAAQSAYAHCQDLQLQMNRDAEALTQAQAEVPVVEAQAQSAINQAQATVNSTQATLNMAEYQQTLQSSPTDPVAEAQAQAALSQAQGQLDQARQALEDATLLAPDSGTVAQVYGAPGEYVGPDGVRQYQSPAALPSTQSAQFSLFPSQSLPPGGSTSPAASEPLIELVGGQQQVMAQVPESQVSGFRPGSSVHVSIAALHSDVTGTVASVVLSPTRSSAAVSYDVIVGLDRVLGGLLPGMSATVRS